MASRGWTAEAANAADPLPLWDRASGSSERPSTCSPGHVEPQLRAANDPGHGLTGTFPPITCHARVAVGKR